VGEGGIIYANGEFAVALLSLPEKKREIIYLYFFGHYTQREIGKCMDAARVQRGITFTMPLSIYASGKMESNYAVLENL